MPYLLGRLNKLYRNTGSYGSPTWSEVTNVRDVKLPFEKTESDASIRGLAGWYAAVACLRKLGVDFQQVYDTTDAAFAAFTAAFMANPNQDVDLVFADGPIASGGTNYVRAVCGIFKWDKGEPLDGVTLVDLSVKPSLYAAAPSYVIVPSFSPFQYDYSPDGAGTGGGGAGLISSDTALFLLSTDLSGTDESSTYVTWTGGTVITIDDGLGNTVVFTTDADPANPGSYWQWSGSVTSGDPSSIADGAVVTVSGM